MRLITDRRVLLGLLIGYCLFLAWSLLAPTSDTQSGLVADLMKGLWAIGFSRGLVTFARMEFVMNAVIIVPAVAAAALLWRRWSWRDWTAGAFVLSGLVELAQGLLLHSRQASFGDVVANTLGALVGAVVGAALWRSTAL